MKTLLFTLEYPPFNGGVANYYGNLASHWPLGENFLVLNNNHDELIKKRRFLAWWPAFLALKRKVAKNDIDYTLVGQILPLGLVAYLLSWLRPFRYAVFLHGLDFSWSLKTPRKKMATALILRRADKIIAANSYVAEQVKKLFPRLANKVMIVNPGVFGAAPNMVASEIENLKQKYNLVGKTALLSLGRLVKRKGVDRVIKALAEMTPEQVDKFIYLVAGSGPELKYLKSLVPRRLFNKIIFLGEITEAEKWLWLSACDIFIMPSRDIAGDFEGFGIVYLEANLCGKPVIAGNSGGVRDAVLDNVTGLIADSENVQDIKEKILELAADPLKQKTLGQAGKDRVVAEFSWEKQAARIAQVLK